MVDVQELRSLFMTKDVMSSKKVVPKTSGGEFGETLSESTLSRDGSSCRPGLAVPDPEKADDSGARGPSGSLPASSDSVLDVMNASGGNPEVSPSRIAGSRAYRLLSGEGASPEETLCEDLRQLKISARVFGAKAGKVSCKMTTRAIPEDKGEDQGSEVPGEGTSGILGTSDGLTEIPVDGAFLSDISPLPVKDEVFSDVPEQGGIFPEEPYKVTQKEQQGVSAEDPSLPVDGYPGSLASESSGLPPGTFIDEGRPFGIVRPGGGTSSPAVAAGRQEIPLVVSETQQESAMEEGVVFPFDEGGSAVKGFPSPAVAAGRQEISPVVSETQQEPAMEEGVVFPFDEGGSVAKGSSSLVVAAGRQEVFPELLAIESESLPLKVVPGEKEQVIRRSADPIDGELLKDLSRSDYEPGDVRFASSVSADGKGYAVGQNPDAPTNHEKNPLTESPEFSVLQGRAGRVPELEKTPATQEDLVSPSSFAVNPMEGMPAKTAGGDVFLEARGVEALSRGLAETVHVIRKRDGHTGTIEVSPPHLGQVRITVESSCDTVQVHLRVESVEARDMLDQTVDVLKQALEEKGLSLTGMSVDVGGQDGGESSRRWGSGSDPVPGLFGDNVADPAEEDEAEEIIARLDLEQGMLHWVA